MTHSKLPELISILTTYVSVFCVRQAVHLSSKVRFICAFQSSHSSDLHRCWHFFIFLVRPTSCHYQDIWTSQRSIFFTSLNRNEAIHNFFLLYWVLLSWITFCNGDLFDSESVSSASPDEMSSFFPLCTAGELSRCVLTRRTATSNFWPHWKWN